MWDMVIIILAGAAVGFFGGYGMGIWHGSRRVK